MKSERQIEALIAQTPDHPGFWDGFRSAAEWILDEQSPRNPFGQWKQYVDPESAPTEPQDVKEKG